MQVNIHEAKTSLSKLIERVAGGEEIVIANRGRPVAVLAPYHTRPVRFGMVSLDGPAQAALDAALMAPTDPNEIDAWEGA
ncbi:MAG: type II toxin-antitoxin system prevent-host-death family antitoxin [Jannaschia sp.]